MSDPESSQLKMAFQPIESDHLLQDLYDLERASYPDDEAASWDSILYRFKSDHSLFLGAFDTSPLTSQEKKLLGFINATLSSEPSLTHDSMSVHDPTGATVCIHSVVVSPVHRRKGIALRMLCAYIRHLKDLRTRSSGHTQLKKVSLISHAYLIPLYEKAGFTLVGKSNVVHGSEPWFELQCEL